MIKDFINKAIDYKKKIGSRYMAIDAERITSKLAQFNRFLVSVKYDGHFYAMIFEEGEANFINRNGKVLDRIHLHDEMEKLLQGKGIKKIFVAGELYLDSDRRTRMFNVSSAIANGGEGLKYAVFDLVELEENIVIDNSVFEKFDTLKEIFPAEANIHVVMHFLTESKSQIVEYFKEKVEIGKHEGLVVKNEGFTIFKIKPKFTFDAVIIGFARSDGERSDMLRDFLLAFIMEDGSYQIFAHLSHGFSEDQRRELLEEYSKKVVKSDYLEVARNKLGFQMVKPETVIEFSCIDVINQNSKGNILKMNLSYDDKTGWKGNYNQPSVSVTIPLFIRFRDDKQATLDDVGFKQVTQVMAFDDIEAVVHGDLPKTDIIRREVYTKESRGAKMVRKFILLKTNKEEIDNYPAYVFHYTDFSSGRKDPLKKEVKVTNSKEQIENLFDEAIEKNIKKGWEKVQ